MPPKQTLALTLLALLALAPAAGAQEASAAPVASALSIRRVGYRVGQSFEFTERTRQSFKLELRTGGNLVQNAPSFDQQVNGDTGVVYRVLAVDGGRVTRCRVRFSRLSLEHTMAGEPMAPGFAIDGNLFTYERQGRDGRRILDDKGQEVPAREVAQLDRLLPVDPFAPRGPWLGELPDRPLRLGERFEASRDLLPRLDLALGMGLKVDRIELTLLRQRPHQGRPCALFAVAIRSQVADVPFPEIDTRFRVRGILLLDLATGAERLLTVSGPLRVRGAQNNNAQPYTIKGDGRLKLRRAGVAFAAPDEIPQPRIIGPAPAKRRRKEKP